MKRLNGCQREAIFQTMSMQAPTLNMVILISQKNGNFFDYHIHFQLINFVQSYRCETLLITHRAV